MSRHAPKPPHSDIRQGWMLLGVSLKNLKKHYDSLMAMQTESIERDKDLIKTLQTIRRLRAMVPEHADPFGNDPL